nr:tetratricopeptide repeat protein [Paramagnetospirillum marisnigri]
MRWYLKAADQEYYPAYMQIGDLYDSGRGVSQDYAEALKWYRKAADLDTVEGEFKVGMYYLQGKGIERNEAEAKTWLTKAAGHVPSSGVAAFAWG